jgi:hypothetical protein
MSKESKKEEKGMRILSGKAKGTHLSISPEVGP